MKQTGRRGHGAPAQARAAATVDVVGTDEQFDIGAPGDHARRAAGHHPVDDVEVGLLRRGAEILGSVDAGRLHRAADLAHEHLAEFPTDRSVRSAVTTALERSPDERVRRRANEFVPP